MFFPSGCTPLLRLKVNAISIARIRDIDLTTYKQVIQDGNWNFNILPETVWVSLPLKLKSNATYRLGSNDTGHGTLYIHQCDAELAPNETATTDTMVDYKEEYLLVRITDDKGGEHLMGTIDEPVRLNFQKLFGQISGMPFQLACRGRNPLYGYVPVVNV